MVVAAAGGQDEPASPVDSWRMSLRPVPPDRLRTAVLGSTLRTLNFGASLVVAFLLTPFVIHSLGDRTYGFWLFVAAFTGYLGLFDLGLAAAVSRHVAGALGRADRVDCQRIFSTSLQFYPLLGALAALATCALAVLAPVLARDHDEASLFSMVILVLGGGLAISLVLQPYFGLLQALGRFDLIARLDLLTLLLRSALIVLVLNAGFGVVAMSWVTSLTGLVRLLLAVYLSRRQLPWLHYARQPFRSMTAKTLFGYSFYMMIAKIADNVRVNTDSLVIAAFLGLASVTPYGIAASLTQKFRDLMMALLGVLQPVYSRLDGQGDHARIKQTLFFATKVAMCISTFVAFGLIAWGEPFIVRWMGATYSHAYPCLVVLAVGWTVQFWQSPSVSLMFATSRHKFYAFTNGIEAVANLLLSLWWVTPLGIIGVALGTAVPMILVRLLLQPYYTCRVMNIGSREYLAMFLGNCGRTFAALVAPVTLAVAYRPTSYPQIVLAAVAASCLYLPVVWLLLFTPQERARLRGLGPVFGNRAEAASA